MIHQPAGEEINIPPVTITVFPVHIIHPPEDFEQEEGEEYFNNFSEIMMFEAAKHGNLSFLRRVLTYDDVCDNDQNDNNNTNNNIPEEGIIIPITRPPLIRAKERTFGSKGESALLYACERKQLQAMQYLIEECEANINDTNKIGEGVLHYCVLNNNIDLLKYLLSMPRKMTAGNSSSYYFYNFIDIISQSTRGSRPADKDDDVHKIEIDLEVVNKYGDSALLLACRLGNYSICELLVKAGADIEAEDMRGWRALHIAVYQRAVDLVRLLVEHGANVDVRDRKNRRSVMEFIPVFLASDEEQEIRRILLSSPNHRGNIQAHSFLNYFLTPTPTTVLTVSTAVATTLLLSAFVYIRSKRK